MHTLGRLECTGKAAISGKMPSSCADLWILGHTLSGLYSVMGTDMVETVYCDFAKLPGDQNKLTISLFQFNSEYLIIIKFDHELYLIYIHCRFPDVDWVYGCQVISSVLLRSEMHLVQFNEFSDSV